MIGRSFGLLRWVWTNFSAGDAALYFAARAIDTLSFGKARLVKYALVAQPVPTAPLVPARGAGATRIRRVEVDDPLVGRFPRPRHVIAKRYADGALCFAAVRGEQEELLGFVWLMHRRYEEDEVRCWFLPQPMHEAVWDFDVYVAPEHRIGRTFTRLWDAVYAYLRSAGVRWTMSRINALNPESLNAHARLGAITVGSALFLCVGKRQWSFVPRNAAVSADTHEGVPVIAVNPPAPDARFAASDAIAVSNAVSRGTR